MKISWLKVNPIDMRSVKTSPNHKLLCYAVDFKGDEVYQLGVLDLATRKLVPDRCQPRFLVPLSFGATTRPSLPPRDAQLRHSNVASQTWYGQ